MESINVNFYSGRKWDESELIRKYPPTNKIWKVGLAEDVASERYFVLYWTNPHENKDPWDRWMLPWRKNESDKTTFKWADTERVYDRESNWEYQFRWTTIAGIRVKLWRKKPVG